MAQMIIPPRNPRPSLFPDLRRPFSDVPPGRKRLVCCRWLDIVEGGYIMTPSTTTLLLQLALLLEDAVPDLEQSRQLVGAVLDRCSVLDAIGRDMGRRERTHQEHRADASV